MDENAAKFCRELIQACDRATLATVERDDPASPYASLVLSACDHAAAPLLFLSDLAEHTKNLGGQPRASLLFDGTAGLSDPLAGRRISVQGEIHPCGNPQLLDRYCARHPSSGLYRGFADFKLYKMTVRRIHIVSGFGYIHWVDGTDAVYQPAGCADLQAAEQDIISHMNADHADAVGLIANVLAGLNGVGWKMTGIDPEGMDLRRGGEIGRVGFDNPVKNARDARDILVRMAAEARKSTYG